MCGCVRVCILLCNYYNFITNTRIILCMRARSCLDVLIPNISWNIFVMNENDKNPVFQRVGIFRLQKHFAGNGTLLMLFVWMILPKIIIKIYCFRQTAKRCCLRGGRTFLDKLSVTLYNKSFTFECLYSRRQWFTVFLYSEYKIYILIYGSNREDDWRKFKFNYQKWPITTRFQHVCIIWREYLYNIRPFWWLDQSL